jgi:hypothetical protein
MERGLRTYPYRVRRGGVQCLWASECEKRPVKILISGQGIDELGVDAVDVVRSVLSYNAKSFAPVKVPITQIHLAIDEREGLITSGLVNDCILSGLLVTRFKKCQRISGFEIQAGSSLDDLGETWYIGSFGSDRLVRCYDKRLERIAAGEDDPGPWYRFEVQSRKRYAMALASAIAVEGLESSGGILRGIIDFREADNDDAERRTPLAWWVSFCDGLCAIRTGVSKSPESLQKIVTWLEKSVSRRLAEVRAVLGNGWLNDLIRNGEKRTDQGVIASLSREAFIDPEFMGFRKAQFQESVFVPF